MAVAAFALGVWSALATPIPEAVRQGYARGDKAAEVAQAGPFTERAPRAAVGDYEFGVCEAGAHVFSGTQLPAIAFRDPAAVAELLGGAPEVDVTFHGPRGTVVTEAAEPGRYGARVRVTWPQGTSSEFTRDLYRVGDNEPLPDDRSEAAAMARAARGGAIADPGAASAAWWHGVRRQLGSAAHYDFFVIPPANPPAAGELRPALVYLHGRSGFGAAGLDALREDRFVQLLRNRADLDAYIVVPHARARWEGPAFAEMLDRLCREHPIDPAAITAFGYSAGASGAWQVALNAPGRLAGIATLAGNPPPAAAASRLAGLHVWAWYGDKDYPAPLAQTRELLDRLAAADPASRFTLLPGVDHHQLPATVLERPDLYAWLAAQRRADR